MVMHNSKDDKLIEISKEERAELFAKQPRPFKGFDSPFVPRGFICYSCGRDILQSEGSLKDARDGRMITGCPFCYRSYCD